LTSQERQPDKQALKKNKNAYLIFIISHISL
jgi:hypothetical protein